MEFPGADVIGTAQGVGSDLGNIAWTVLKRYIHEVPKNNSPLIFISLLFYQLTNSTPIFNRFLKSRYTSHTNSFNTTNSYNNLETTALLPMAGLK